jgi:hypothetical protein
MSFTNDFKRGVGNSAIFFASILLSTLVINCSAVGDNSFSESITLPGSTDQAGFGNKVTSAHKDRLTREYEYVGA